MKRQGQIETEGRTQTEGQTGQSGASCWRTSSFLILKETFSSFQLTAHSLSHLQSRPAAPDGTGTWIPLLRRPPPRLPRPPLLTKDMCWKLMLLSVKSP